MELLSLLESVSNKQNNKRSANVMNNEQINEATCISRKKIFDKTVHTSFKYEWHSQPATKRVNLGEDADYALLMSKKFVTKSSDYTLNWDLTCYYFASRDFVGLSLALVSSDVTNLSVHAQCFVKDIVDIEESILVLDHYYDSNVPSTKKGKYKNRKSIKHTNKSLPVEIIIDIIHQLQVESTLVDDLEQVLLDGTLSDVVCCFGNKELKAHKVLLAARSPVFASMFTHNMLEKKNNRIEIKDVEPDIFEELLKFLYTEKIPLITFEKWSELILAAEKYNISDLKRACERGLAENINIERAVEILILSDQVNSKVLKGQTIAYIIANKNEVTETSSYKEMVKTHVHLVDEMFRKIIAKC